MKKTLIVFFGILLTANTTVAQLTLQDSLIAYYPFNGNANDESGNAHDGTVNGSVLTTDRFGNLNSAYSFDGIDDYINVPHNDELNFDTCITISAWIKAIDFDNSSMISAKGRNNALNDRNFQFSNNRIGYARENTEYFCTGNYVNTNNWHHILGIINTNTDSMYLYQDGRLVAQYSSPLPEMPSIPNYSLIIGAVNSSTLLKEFFHGELDELRFYNRQLSNNEIQQLYANYYPPDTLITKPGDEQVTLSWDTLGWSNLDTVYIFRDHILIDSVEITSVTDTFYIDQGLNNRQSYAYNIQSLDTFGNLSIFSDTVLATPNFIAEGLVAYYYFDNNTNDESGNGNDG
ncbi:MAG: LamG domain-containing protein, partial [Bacteroidetes bacterium]|nr:LamG domain-containing protein [Bacteroidota bacterium]